MPNKNRSYDPYNIHRCRDIGGETYKNDLLYPIFFNRKWTISPELIELGNFNLFYLKEYKKSVPECTI